MTPKARVMSHCFAYPLSQENWLVIMRKVATSSSAWTNAGMWPLKYRDLAVPPFKRQFVGDVGYARGKHRQMTLRHNTVSPLEPTELRPAPGSFLNPIERVTYRPARTPSFAQPIDANRYFDAPSLQPEGRRSGGLNSESRRYESRRDLAGAEAHDDRL